MVVKIRGIMQCLRRVSWNNSHFVRFDLIPSRCGYHNLNCERHTGSQNDALLYLNVLKPVIIRKGSNVQSAKDTDMTPKDYRILYRFPHVPVCGFVNKVKKRFTTFMAVGVPTSYLLRLMDVISTDTFFFFITQGMMLISVAFHYWEFVFIYIRCGMKYYVFYNIYFHILCLRVLFRFTNCKH